MTNQRASNYTKTDDRLDAWCNTYGWGLDLNYMTGKCRIQPSHKGHWKSFNTFAEALEFIEKFVRNFKIDPDFYRMP